MKVEHHFELMAVCPVDGKVDFYKAVVFTTAVIQVEVISKVCESLKAEKLYQEDLTKELHRILGCEVETTGWHGRVFTKVRCGNTP